MALPAVLVAAILLLWVGTHPGVAPWVRNRATGNPMPLKGDVSADSASGVITVTLTNESPSMARCSFSKVSWNGALVKEQMPRDFGMEPFSRRSWTFHPVNDKVPSYGKATFVAISWKTPEGNGGATFGAYGAGPLEVSVTKAGKSARSIGLLRRPIPGAGSRPLELEGLRVGFGGKSVPLRTAPREIGDSQLLLLADLPDGAKGKGVVKCRYRETPWSPWVSMARYFEVK